MKNKKDIEILPEPLLTEEGFIDAAGMQGLENAINNSPKTYERLSGDDEWNTKHWTFKKSIVGALAKWACRQSPYGCPDGLENVCKYLDACLSKTLEWKMGGMEELSLIDINKLCWDILGDCNIFLSWNKSEEGNNKNILFVNPMLGEVSPDYDFIDLDALLHNVCLDIRDERRLNAKFDREFEEKYGKNYD